MVLLEDAELGVLVAQEGNVMGSAKYPCDPSVDLEFLQEPLRLVTADTSQLRCPYCRDTLCLFGVDLLREKPTYLK